MSSRTCGQRVPLVVVGFVCRNDLFDILERQKQLLGIELLRAPAELCALQLAQQMPQPVILRQRLVALGKRGVALGPRRCEERLQRVDVDRQLRCGIAHARK